MRTRLALFLIILFPLGFVAQAQQNEEELEVRYNQYGVKVDRQKLQAEARDGIWSLNLKMRITNYGLILVYKRMLQLFGEWKMDTTQ